MRFSPDAQQRDIEDAYPRFIGLVGLSNWNRRLQRIEKWRLQDPLYQAFLVERYGPELAFEEIQAFSRSRGRLPFPPTPIHHNRLCNLALTVTRVYEHLSGAARARLIGYVRTCLTLEYGLGPVIFEMQVIAHLMRQGFDVVLNDLENGGGFDFLATRGGSEIEIECKHISADVGRQIHKRKLLDLGTRLRPAVEAQLAIDGEMILLDAVLPGRLVSTTREQDAIIDAVTACITQNAAVERPKCAVNISRHPIDRSHPILSSTADRTLDELIAVFGPLADLNHRSVFFIIRPGRGICAIQIRSSRRDLVISRIIEHLKDDAERQFTKNRPALLCAHFADLTAEQLQGLNALPREQNLLNHAVTQLFERRPFLHTIGFTAAGAIVQERDSAGRLMAQGLQDSAVTYYNHEHPSAADANLQGIFRHQ
jgi:hypothetical protein